MNLYYYVVLLTQFVHYHSLGLKTGYHTRPVELLRDWGGGGGGLISGLMFGGEGAEDTFSYYLFTKLKILGALSSPLLRGPCYTSCI